MHNFQSTACPNRNHLKVDWIEDQVKDWITDWFHDPDSKWAEFIEQTEETHNYYQEQLKGVRKRRAKLEDKIARARWAYTEVSSILTFWPSNRSESRLKTKRSRPRNDDCVQS